MPARMGQARPLASILEKEWDADLFKSARPVGLAVTLTGLASAGAEVYLWRPSDLDEIARILGHRQRFLFDVYDVPVLSERTGSSGAHWQPGSLWLPAGCRSDERGVA